MKVKKTNPKTKYVENTLLASLNIFKYYFDKKATTFLSIIIFTILIVSISSISIFTAEDTVAVSYADMADGNSLSENNTLSQNNETVYLQQLASAHEQLELIILKGLDMISNLSLDDIMAIPIKPITAEQMDDRIAQKTKELLENAYRANLVLRYANEYEIPALLVVAVIFTESHNNPYAVSRRGARGLMQLMPGTAELIARNMGMTNIANRIKNDPDTIFDQEINIQFGCRYLNYLYNRFGSWENALHSYNMGPGNFQRGRRNNIYTTRIIDDWNRFEEELKADFF